MKIVTGYTGTPHITSNDQQGLNQGIFGTDSYVLNVGQKFNATLNTATTITIEDGEGMMQGVHFRIDPGDTEAVTINPGTPGFNRIDLICARYTKDSTTGIESVELAAIEGTPSEGAASDPEYTTGDIRMGDTIVDYPLWKVSLSGVSPELTRVEKISGDKLLWTNPNPGNTSQNTLSVSLDLSEYDFIEVHYKYNSPSTGPYYDMLHAMQITDHEVIAKHPVGASGIVSYSESTMYDVSGSVAPRVKITSRQINVTASGISWGKPMVAVHNFSTANNFSVYELSQWPLVPYKVYGKHFA